MPTYLRQDLPASVTDAQVAKYFGNIKTIRAVGWGNPIRDGAISACTFSFPAFRAIARGVD